MQIPALNANIIISLVLIGVAAYGLLVGKHRLRILILSIYVGIVLAEQMSSIVAPQLKMIGPDQISWLLLGLPILVFGLTGTHAKGHDKGAAIANIIVGLFAGCLIVSSALHLLPVSQMAAIDNDSFLAQILQQYHLWFLGLMPLVALLFGLMKSDHPAR